MMGLTMPITVCTIMSRRSNVSLRERIGGCSTNGCSGRELLIDGMLYRADRPTFQTAGNHVFEAKRHKVILAFANAMHQLDFQNRSCGVPDPFKAEHHVRSGLDIAMVLVG
ncbi:hypothetical protein EOS_41875 [Caballeronia mineralivorans PML1(12)]|uniref:Uncharacterized protein n=1 Tax=Caballeronia mineralivorans PML1(12) TaxID=908627 RepID=A0A0J1FKZ4_9BURK|nr:hypothetical protein EOS_41875 [Caballeronia mineralivorans PML1(12)]